MAPCGATPLVAWLAERCAAPGGLPFRDFMAAALYHPQWGYYASGKALIGRGGDFITSVSVGPCFGQLLARRIARWHAESACGPAWPLVEQGAHDGHLMADILEALASHGTAGPQVFLVEPFPALRARQEATLAPWAGAIRWVASLDHLPAEAKAGVFVANELLDAFPVERVRVHGARWHRLHVAATGDPSVPFTWACATAAPPDLAAALAGRPAAGYPEGYTTDVRPQLGEWARALASHAAPRLALLADYGFEEADYFHPSRTDGTLRCYTHQRAHDDPLAAPGEADITAHVNWTAVVDALAAAGFAVAAPRDQGKWLTAVAMPRLAAIEAGGPPDEPTRAWLRQFLTLSHPAHLGARFQIVETRLDPARPPIPG